MASRTETDTLGKVEIPEDKLWGAQTGRSLENFQIGQDLMPFEVIQALAQIKQAASRVNFQLGLLDTDKAKAIETAAKEVSGGKWRDHFPLSVWQTGSGTQTNMNVNEVIANRASEILGGKRGDKRVHPNDDVNLSQSSNDTFPSAMRMAVYIRVQKELLPAILDFEKVLEKKVKEFKKVVKIGRTHLMDATPLTLGQEFSAFMSQIQKARIRVEIQSKELLELPLGGTAVGTGLNTHPDYAEKVCGVLKRETGHSFLSAKNKFEHIAAHDSLLQMSGTLKTLAASLMKMGNDIRLLSSGPRSGLGEIHIPANEPGSSIMPGKVNPTQCEALTMLAAQVMSQDMSVTLGASLGQLQLNTFKPLIVFNLLRSVTLLADGLNNFRKKCLEGISPNLERVKFHLENSLMLVTALNPHIGYEKACSVAKLAYEQGISLKEAAVSSGLLSAEEFDRLVKPEDMTSPNLKRSFSST